ncbi:MAG: DUF115 domain-containing protein, partial [Treponema sp.]|nr:DUF115 domain-containing protein [Treponema sp.]
MNSGYTLLKSRTGETVPAIVQPDGNTKALHSLVDPKREAERLVSTTLEGTGFLVFLGLGGGFLPQAALEQTASIVLVIDFNITELLTINDYSCLRQNKRFSLLTDPSSENIKNFILENYIPSLHGGIKVIPLRTRTEFDQPLFDMAAETIKETIEIITADYSVQAHFGKKWFSNIIRNLQTAENMMELPKTPIQEAAVVAAGPSLDRQLAALAEHKSQKVFIICSDTALPVLLQNGIKPDMIVSIDCQHISYYHFFGCEAARNIPLVLDIASPPMLARLSNTPVFFASGHPLVRYICAHWFPFPMLDTSGGNVTYACLSLAEHLGAKRITLFGAD